MNIESVIKAGEEYWRLQGMGNQPEGAVDVWGIFRLAQHLPCCEVVKAGMMRELVDRQDVPRDAVNSWYYPIKYQSQVWRQHGSSPIHLCYKHDVPLWLFHHSLLYIKYGHGVPDSVLAEYAELRLTGIIGPGVDPDETLLRRGTS